METNVRNIIWLGLILVSAGITYGMMSQRLEAVETKQNQLEMIILQDIPEIKERVIRLEILLEQALAKENLFGIFSHYLTSQIYFSI